MNEVIDYNAMINRRNSLECALDTTAALRALKGFVQNVRQMRFPRCQAITVYLDTPAIISEMVEMMSKQAREKCQRQIARSAKMKDSVRSLTAPGRIVGIP